jgi:hypothetical protein
MEQICSVEGCGRSGRIVRGYCHMHYQRWCRYGNPDTVKGAFSKILRNLTTVPPHGMTLDGWLRNDRNCTDAQIARITARRWQYGSYRPSFIQDGVHPPYAPLRWHEGVDDAVAA